MTDSTNYKLYLAGFPVGVSTISCRSDFISINNDLDILARCFEHNGFVVRETYMRDPMDALNVSLEAARGTQRYTVKCVESPTVGLPSGFVPEWPDRFKMLVDADTDGTISSGSFHEHSSRPECYVLYLPSCHTLGRVLSLADITTALDMMEDTLSSLGFTCARSFIGDLVCTDPSKPCMRVTRDDKAFDILYSRGMLGADYKLGLVPNWIDKVLAECPIADSAIGSPEPILKPEALRDLYGVAPLIDTCPGPDVVSRVRAYDDPVTTSDDPSEDPDLADKLFGSSVPTPEPSSVTPEDLDTIDRFLYTEMGITESSMDYALARNVLVLWLTKDIDLDHPLD